MSQSKPRTDSPPAQDQAQPALPTPSLSRFEGHCLCRRTRECEELLQLAVLGVEQVQERHCADQDLAEIASHLAEAEQHVEIARRLAARWSE
jgi:hypothetical protein